MDPLLQSSRRRYRDHVFVWDKKYTNRQLLQHQLNDQKLTLRAHQSPITAFLEERASELDLPQYSYPALTTFLEKADSAVIQMVPTPPGHTRKLAWVDDRSDTSGWKDSEGQHHSPRDWEGYSRFPPEGVDISTSVLDVGGLFRRLCARVSSSSIPLIKQR